MKTLIFIFISVWTVVFCSCNTQDKKMKTTENIKSTEQPTNNLAGHVYSFGPSIDTAKCEVLIECDCCSDDFLFVNDKDFIQIGYCMSAKYVVKGTYSINQDNIIINYDSLHYFTEADNNYEIKTVSKGSSEYLINIEKRKPFTDTLKKFSCNGTYLYTIDYTIEKSFGTVSTNDSINTYIDMLKNEGFWKKMNLQ